MVTSHCVVVVVHIIHPLSQDNIRRTLLDDPHTFDRDNYFEFWGIHTGLRVSQPSRKIRWFLLELRWRLFSDTFFQKIVAPVGPISSGKVLKRQMPSPSCQWQGHWFTAWKHCATDSPCEPPAFFFAAPRPSYGELSLSRGAELGWSENKAILLNQLVKSNLLFLQTWENLCTLVI